MIYLKKFNENFTSATGGLAMGRAGEVSNHPISNNSDVISNSIQTNSGGIDMNNTQKSETYDIEQIKEEPKQKKKSKIQKDLQKKERKKQPVMNWNIFIKQNINKINI